MSQYKSIALFLDNPGSIEIYHEFARSGNHDLLHLAKNPQNVKEISTKKYDLIIVDISHPSMAEIEFIDALHTISENIPIIVVSSFFYDTREIVFGNKIRGFIQNPLTVQKLEATASPFLIHETRVEAPAPPAKVVDDVVLTNRRLTVLLEISRSLTSITDLDELLSHIIKMAAEVLQAERATLFIYDKNTNELWSRTGIGLKASEIRFPSNQGVAGEIFQGGQSLIISDPYKHPTFNKGFDLKSGFTTKNILGFPLKNINGEVIGVIQLLNKKQGTFDGEDESYLGALASAVGIVLENALLREKLKKQLEEIQQAYAELDIAQNTILRETKFATIFELTGIVRKAASEHNVPVVIAELRSDYLFDSKLLRYLDVIEGSFNKILSDTEEFARQNGN
ncbi:MAG: GAF domain-containing protein [Ignavibacteriales bacterium]|nr:GAF domain-containing protein [Ignavibacteriales bacterium]